MTGENNTSSLPPSRCVWLRSAACGSVNPSQAFHCLGCLGCLGRLAGSAPLQNAVLFTPGCRLRISRIQKDRAALHLSEKAAFLSLQTEQDYTLPQRCSRQLCVKCLVGSRVVNGCAQQPESTKLYSNLNLLESKAESSQQGSGFKVQRNCCLG